MFHTRVSVIALVFVLTGISGCDQTPEQRTPRRTDFTPAEFGVGRSHTPNPTCNRQIDRLLDEIRVCFNTRPEAECNALQQKHSDTIANLKGTLRCRRSPS